MENIEKLLLSWESAKTRVHDITGIDNPEDWKYQCVNGIYYPSLKIEKPAKTKEEIMFDELDPDMSNEELEAAGWIVKHETEI